MPRRYWLFKSDPESFAWSDLKRAPKSTTAWDGVRNYQARNMLRDDVKVGDSVLFYHSQVPPIGIFGTANIVRAAYADPSQFDSKSKYYDSLAEPKSPRWFMVDLQLDQEFGRPVLLSDLRDAPGLEEMMVLRKGSRLSIQPVTADEWERILKMGSRA